MTTPNPLTRAHALSAQASDLLRPLNPSIEDLRRALDAYTEATELYQSSIPSSSSIDNNNNVRASSTNINSNANTDGQTLRLLVNQHRKLVKDVQRRLSQAQAQAHAQASTSNVVHERRTTGPSSVTTNTAAGTGQSRNGPSSSPLNMRRGDNLGAGVGLGAAGSLGSSPWQAPGIASRLSPPRGVPPFAIRPPLTTPSSNLFPDSLSPLYSSSSSSDAAAGEESYVHFGGIPDTLDPFSRFWGMLENVLEDISNPVAFATAPLDIPLPPSKSNPTSQQTTSFSTGTGAITGRKKEKDRSLSSSSKKIKERSRPPSPFESFYLVQTERRQDGNDSDVPSSAELNINGGTSKTLEELDLENTSLRSSLDAMALHTQAVENSNKQLKSALEERDKKLKTAMIGMKREALVAKEGQREMLRSGMLASTASIASTGIGSGGRPTPSVSVSVTGTLGQSGRTGIGSNPESTINANATNGGKDDFISASARKRIKELEEQVRSLQNDNTKQRAQVDKYKERFEQLKASARAKKEAKLAAAAAADAGAVTSQGI